MTTIHLSDLPVEAPATTSNIFPLLTSRNSSHHVRNSTTMPRIPSLPLGTLFLLTILLLLAPASAKRRQLQEERQHESLGLIVSTSPSNALSNMDTINAGSHWYFLTCETPGMSSKTQQTLRAICTTAGEADSNCDIICGDGVEGTVVKVPRGCFEGDYAVLHGMVEAEDQSMAAVVKGGKVVEMTISGVSRRRRSW
ncbi:hypothetical protein DFP73DRAFT_611236 [Morchella snyderi]|nr:hypothetical protein DFP73DRAFT_611236 [Morchella snyderi]